MSKMIEQQKQLDPTKLSPSGRMERAFIIGDLEYFSSFKFIEDLHESKMSLNSLPTDTIAIKDKDDLWCKVSIYPKKRFL